MKRSIAIEGTDKVLRLSKFATPRVVKQFIHLDRLPDGTWNLLFNVEGVDVKDVLALKILRED